MSITATKVSDENRMDFLPENFGSKMLWAENYIYNVLSNLCSQYTGGYWEFYELSNNGFYMAPTESEKMLLQSWFNQFEGEVSADAAGIIATLYTLNALCMKTNSNRFLEDYENLLDFAELHKEASKIFAAID